MSAHKDRLIQAAELLGMAPDDLLSRLDVLATPGAADAMLADARTCAAEGLEGHALRRYRKLDEMMTRGGRLPEAWAPAAFAEREAARTEAIAGHLPTDVPGEEPTHAGCIIGTRGASHTAGCPSSFPFGSAWDDES